MQAMTQLPCCPRCGSSSVKPVPVEGPLEYLLRFVHIYPLQCQICWRRALRHCRSALPTVSKHDRRRFDRITCSLLATFTTETAPGEGVIIDLALGGCRLHTTAALAVGTSLRMELQTTTETPTIIIERAVVRWTWPQVVGVEFVVFQPQARMALSDYIQQQHTTAAQQQRRSKHFAKQSVHF